MMRLKVVYREALLRLRLLLCRLKGVDITCGRGTWLDAGMHLDTSKGPIRIGSWCKIHCMAMAGPIDVGDRVLLNLGTDVSGREAKVVIGDDVLVAPRVSIIASSHNYKERSRTIRSQGTTGADIAIGNDAWLCTNVVVLPGVSIGAGAVVGANSVVTRDCEAYGIYVGSPARKIGERA